MLAGRPLPSGRALGRTRATRPWNTRSPLAETGNMAEQRLQIPLEPVDSLTITTLVDNVFDVFMPDQGPAHRISPAAAGHRLASATMLDGSVPDQLIAEHGLSFLLTVTKGESTHRLLFDTGVSPG